MKLEEHQHLKKFAVTTLIKLAPVNLNEVNEGKHYWVAKMLKEEAHYDMVTLMNCYKDLNSNDESVYLACARLWCFRVIKEDISQWGQLVLTHCHEIQRHVEKCGLLLEAKIEKGVGALCKKCIDDIKTA